MRSLPNGGRLSEPTLVTMPLQIRRLDRSGAALLRELRIAALKDAPQEFGETLAEALSRSDREWSDLASSTYVAEVDGHCVGMAFAFEDRSDLETARVGGMWVAPGARRAGVGSRLMEAVLHWATSENMRRVRLWVSPTTPAEELYRRANFAPTGNSKPFPRDHSRSVMEMECELNKSG